MKIMLRVLWSILAFCAYPAQGFIGEISSPPSGVEVTAKLERDSTFWYHAPASGGMLLSLSIDNLSQERLSGEVRLIILAVGSQINFDALKAQPVLCETDTGDCAQQTGFYAENITLGKLEKKQIALSLTLPMEYCANSVNIQVALLFRGHDEKQKAYTAKDMFFVPNLGIDKLKK